MIINILDTIDMHKLGQALQLARTEYSMTLEKAANVIEIEPITLTAIEKGERRIKADELIKLAYAYGCQVSDFVGRQPKVEPFQGMPTRNHYLSVDAFDRGLITEGQLARFLALDRVETRYVAETLRQHIRDMAGDTTCNLAMVQFLDAWGLSLDETCFDPGTGETLGRYI